MNMMREERIGIKKKTKNVGILGLFPYAGVAPEKIEHGMEHLVKDGYNPVMLENLDDPDNFSLGNLQLNWVVTVGGLPLAQYMEKKFHIPYIAAFPVGMRAMRLWRAHIAKLLGYEDNIEIPQKHVPNEASPKMLLLGDPVLTAGMKNYFEDMLGYTNIVRAHYTQLKSVRAWNSRIIERSKGHGLCVDEYEEEIIGSVEVCNADELNALLTEADIIIGDPVIKNKFPLANGKRWIDFADCDCSCGVNNLFNYELFGKKGAAWLNEQLAASE